MDNVDKAVAESRAARNNPELKHKIKANRKARRTAKAHETLMSRQPRYVSRLDKAARKRIQASKRRNRK